MRIATVTLNPAFDLHYEMEKFEVGKENYVGHIRCDAGGKGINISRALTANGVPNTAYVILGRENAAAFETALQKDGMDYVPFYTDGRVRENITLHPVNDRETRISLDQFSVDPYILEQLEVALSENSDGALLLAFAGRLPKGLEKSKVIDLLVRLRERGARLIIDSNSFTPDDLTLIRPWLIKPNEEEIESFLHRPVKNLFDAAEAASALVLHGVAEEVLISLGGDGAAWSNGRDKLTFTVPKLAHPVSTIGAGDSTLAGFLTATVDGEARERALCRALAFGTAACMREGTAPPMREDIVAVLRQIEVCHL